MRSSRSSLAALAALAAMSAGSFMTPSQSTESPVASEARTATKTTPATLNRFAQQARDIASIFNVGRWGTGRRAWPGLGWSVAQDRRNAKKRRAVARNRRAQKRAGR